MTGSNTKDSENECNPRIQPPCLIYMILAASEESTTIRFINNNFMKKKSIYILTGSNGSAMHAVNT